jgi:methylated-DNA-[protein]-cysteine S-methyltransferase
MSSPTSDPQPLCGVVTSTALGYAGVALSDAGIRHATLFHRTREAAWTELSAFGAQPGPDPRAEQVSLALDAYAAGSGDSLEAFPVDLPPASDLNQRTWLALREIPCGETRSYSWLARRVGQPGAARLIGAIVGANPIPLWLPCHRIIASDGNLQGFGGGLAMKRALLELEGALPLRLALD